jgi:hypothetical protein
MDKAVQQDQDDIFIRDIVLKIRSYIKYIQKQWLTLLIIGVLGGILGLAYAVIKKPVYTATCSFVLEENKSSGGLSQYASLASIAGIDIGGSGGGVFEGDNIIALYTSRTMIAKALLDTVYFNNKPLLLIDRYVNFLHLRDKWQNKDKISNINFNGPEESFNRVQDSLLIDIVANINKNVLEVSKPDKKLNIIDVDVHFGDELFAKSFNDKLVATVNDFYVKTKTKKNAINVDVLQRQTDSIKRVLNSSIGGVASALDAAPNANPALLSLRVPSQRKQIDVQASSAIYAGLQQNLELAKISLRQETPLIQILDNPILPLEVKRSSKIADALAGFFIAAFLTLGFLFLKKQYTKLIHVN